MTPQFLRFQNTCLNTIFAGLQFLQFHCDQSETISTEYNFNRRAERASEIFKGYIKAETGKLSKKRPPGSTNLGREKMRIISTKEQFLRFRN